MVITYIVLVILLLVSVMFVLRKKLVRVLDFLLKILFVLLVLAVLSALFIPSIYESTVDQGLQTAGTYELIIEIDNNLSQIQNIPNNVVEGLQGLFGGSSGQHSNAEVEAGFLEDTLYLGLVLGVSAILRVAVISMGVAALILLTYVQYSVGGAADIATLETRVRELESRIADLQISELESVG